MKGDKGKDKDGFAIFSTLEAGWKAFITMVGNWQTGESTRYFPNDNLLQWAQKYDPKNSSKYARNLARHLGVPIKTRLQDISVDVLAKGIAQLEDGNCYRALKAKGIIK